MLAQPQTDCFVLDNYVVYEAEIMPVPSHTGSHFCLRAKTLMMAVCATENTALDVSF